MSQTATETRHYSDYSDTPFRPIAERLSHLEAPELALRTYRYFDTNEGEGHRCDEALKALLSGGCCWWSCMIGRAI